MASKTKTKPEQKKAKPFPEAARKLYTAPDPKWNRFEVSPANAPFNYSTKGPFCKVDRLKQGRCATQLNFIDGKPVLRLCDGYQKPGRVIPVSSPEDAHRKASKYCATKVGSKRDAEPETLDEIFPMQVRVVATGEKWTQKVEADSDAEAIVKVSRMAKTKNAMKRHGDVAVAPPGYYWNGHTWKKTQPIWIAAGILMGITAAAIIKNKQWDPGGS